MRCRSGSTALLALITFLFVSPPSLAAESYDNCTGFIGSVPAVINTQGTWCLRHDLGTNVASGAAVTIAANNVTIDCNDFKIGGLAAGPGTQAVGINAHGRANVVVRNCNVRGFKYGLRFTGDGASGGHLVEDSRFDGNTYRGLEVAGDGSTVRRNLVSDTGGSTTDIHAEGIVAVSSVDVIDNTISNVVAGDGYATGITVWENLDGSIAGNRVRGVLNGTTGIARGVLHYGGGNLAIRDNDLAGNAVTGSVGISCVDIMGDPVDSGTTKDNVINSFAAGLSGCSNDGGNVISP